MSEGKLNNYYCEKGRSYFFSNNCEEGRSPDVNISAIFLTLLFPFSAHATCTPTPDCADMGYTETSCEGKFVRCPFDTSKLFCTPCDSAYQYTCTNEGQSGKGNSCNGKYIECECSDGYDLVDGNCTISCAYTATSLPTGCSSADSCEKNSTTYYSSTCTTCKDGYTLSSGSCSANACSGYYTSKTGCSSYSICLSGTTTKYKCTACNSGYTLSSGQCNANTCSGYASISQGCSSYTTCSTPTTTYYKCSSCESGYTLLDNTICIDNACSEYFTENQDALIDYGMWPQYIKINNGYNTDCTYSCTGNNQLEYIAGWCDFT